VKNHKLRIQTKCVMLLISTIIRILKYNMSLQSQIAESLLHYYFTKAVTAS
jgi:hypothetical protein